MSSLDCQRWMELSDRAAVGEAVSDRDQAWLAQHARACSDCGQEAGFYASLRDAVGRPEMLVVSSPTPRPVVRRSRTRIAVTVGLALAASLVVAVGLGRKLGGKPHPPVAVPVAPLTGRVLYASGEAQLGSTPARAGQSVVHGERLATGNGMACLAVAGSITVCLDAASTAVVSLADPLQPVVFLEQGRLLARLDHQPAERRFLVRTAQAEVRAVGTRFSVGVSRDGQTQVRLHEGKVAVRAANHLTSDLAAPAQAQVSDDIRVAPMPAEATREDEVLTDLSALPRSETASTVHLGSIPAGADVLVDNLAMGKTPVSTVITADTHVRLTMPGYAPVSEWISIASGAPTERTFTLSALPAPAEPVEHPRAHRSANSPGRLLATAQALRARGAYAACAQIYRRLCTEFPSSEEAKVSMISLGELELGQRNHPAAALDAFSAYLRDGGSLEREARFGRIRALRALGRDGDAERESAAFLRDYPTSVQAATLRRRVHEK